MQEGRTVMVYQKSYGKYLLLNLFLIFSVLVSHPVAAELRVAVSIAPIHSLVASMVAGASRPYLVMRQNVSPHSYQLTPSKAVQLSRADLVIWIGKDFERALGKIIKTLPQRVMRLALGEAGCTTPGESRDLHIWLNPVLAVCLVQHIRTVLIRLDGEYEDLYRENARLLIARLKKLDQELAAQLAPLKGKRYLVFHDAYTHFEKRYGLKSAGFFRSTPGRLPGARHLVGLRRKIAEDQISCIFTEPEFIPAQVRAIVRETGLRTGVLDPLGSRLKPGPELYFQLMRHLAWNLRNCFMGK
jgi:zinc transport system substrate-binding protein